MVRSTAWATAKSNTNISICEMADIESPTVPIRSWAYHLAPIAIGTPNTESLTSYFIRLVGIHLVTPRTFFLHSMSKASNGVSHRDDTYTDGLIGPTDTKATHQINGNGIAAEKWVPSIEGLTQRNNLRFLTFLPWKGILSNRTMHRRSRAWCPSCFEDQRAAGLPPHEQLRWSHRIVQMCPDHRIQLETKCPHCKSSSTVLCGRSRPGLCSQCKGWLGYYPNNASAALAEYNSTNEALEVFIAEQIGELIAIAPRLTFAITQDTPRTSITRCVNRFFDGNFLAFVRFFGIKKGGTDCFYMAKPRHIDLKLLMKVAFNTSTTLLNLLTNENALAEFDPTTSTTTVSKRLSPRLKKENVLARLLEALEEKPPPSPNDIAKRLGYRHAYTLRRYFPQIYDQIRANYLKHSQGKRRGGWSTNRLQSDEAILAALEAALREELPSSVEQIARTLGYTASQALRQKFPELCKVLAEKRRIIMTDRRARIEGELKRAIEGIPPTSLNAVSDELGYKTTATLRTMFPKECREIHRRYEEHLKNQLLTKVANTLRTILIETPPPPLNAALRRIGISDGFLRKHFPKEHRAISARSLKYRHQQSSENKEDERKKIKAIVLDLINRKVIPSMNIVLELLSSSYLRRTEVWATIKQAREQLSPKT